MSSPLSEGRCAAFETPPIKIDEWGTQRLPGAEALLAFTVFVGLKPYAPSDIAA